MDVEELEVSELVLVVEAGVEKVEAETKAAEGVKIGVPLGKEPGVFVFAGDGIAFAAEHEAVSGFDKGAEIGAGTRHDEEAEVLIEFLGEVGEPEEFAVLGLEGEIVEDDFIAGKDGGFAGAEPEVWVFDIVSGDSGVFTDEKAASIFLYDAEFSGFHEDGVDSRSELAGVEGFPVDIVGGGLSSIDDAVLVEADVSGKADETVGDVPDRAVGGGLEVGVGF